MNRGELLTLPKHTAREGIQDLVADLAINRQTGVVVELDLQGHENILLFY